MEAVVQSDVDNRLSKLHRTRYNHITRHPDRSSLSLLSTRVQERNLLRRRTDSEPAYKRWSIVALVQHCQHHSYLQRSTSETVSSCKNESRTTTHHDDRELVLWLCARWYLNVDGETYHRDDL